MVSVTNLANGDKRCVSTLIY